MSPDAKKENERCQFVVAEFKTMLQSNNVPAPIIELCKQIEDRIELRRLLDVSVDKNLDYSKWTNR